MTRQEARNKLLQMYQNLTGHQQIWSNNTISQLFELVKSNPVLKTEFLAYLYIIAEDSEKESFIASLKDFRRALVLTKIKELSKVNLKVIQGGSEKTPKSIGLYEV